MSIQQCQLNTRAWNIMEVVALRICFPTPTAFCGFRFLLKLLRNFLHYNFLHFIPPVWTPVQSPRSLLHYNTLHFCVDPSTFTAQLTTLQYGTHLITCVWTQRVTYYFSTLNNPALHNITYFTSEQIAQSNSNLQQASLCNTAQCIVHISYVTALHRIGRGKVKAVMIF